MRNTPPFLIFLCKSVDACPNRCHLVVRFGRMCQSKCLFWKEKKVIKIIRHNVTKEGGQGKYEKKRVERLFLEQKSRQSRCSTADIIFRYDATQTDMT
jgi:hypothetical protein